MSKRQAILEQIEALALAAGPIASSMQLPPLDPKISQQLIRSRRLRVLDWLSQSGLRILNIITDINERFLAFCTSEDLFDKYEVPFKLVRSREIFGDDDNSRALASLAELEAYMVVSRRDRQPYPSVHADSKAEETLLLSEGIHLFCVPAWTLEAHEMLPDFSVTKEAASQLQEKVLTMAHNSREQKAYYLSAESTEQMPGFTAEIDAQIYEALKVLQNHGMTRIECQNSIPSNVFKELNDIGAFRV